MVQVWQKSGKKRGEIVAKNVANVCGEILTVIFAVESTRTGFLPPSSNRTGVRCLAAAANTILATTGLPETPAKQKN